MLISVLFSDVTLTWKGDFCRKDNMTT